MADIILNKPEAGTQAVFEAAGDSRIDLNFPTDQATLERSGNDLISVSTTGAPLPCAISIRPIPRNPCPTS